MEADDNKTGLRIASFSCYLNPEESFVKKLGGTYEEEPYPAETPFSVSSVRDTKAPITQDKLVNFRVESFSSYLKTDQEDNFAFKTAAGAAPVQDPTIAFVFPQQASVGTPKQQEKTKSKDGELSIFGADKYFNMKLDYAAVPPSGVVKYRGQLNTTTVDLPHLKPNSRTKTPSICSEASSFNSQSGLLQNLERNRCQTKQKKMTGRQFFASFGCQGPCLNRKAVYVDERLELGKTDHLSGTEKLTVVKKHLSHDQDPSIEEQRKSIEVFGSGKMGKGDISVNLERKLSMLTWDAIPKSQNQNSTVIDDMASDASSDLFEIDNISSSGYGVMNSQNVDSYIPGYISPRTQYAPSEASIEWSVITASAAEYSSVISDYDAKNINISRNAASTNTKPKNAVSKEGQKSRQGGILGCKNHKAVSVVETVNKTGEKAKHHQRG